MNNKETFRKLIYTLCSELASGSDVFLVNQKIAEKAGFPEGTTLNTPVGKIILKYTNKSIMGFETKRKAKAA